MLYPYHNNIVLLKCSQNANATTQCNEYTITWVKRCMRFEKRNITAAHIPYVLKEIAQDPSSINAPCAVAPIDGVLGRGNFLEGYLRLFEAQDDSREASPKLRKSWLT